MIGKHHKDDWVHNWRSSVAVKISGAVLYAIVLIGFIVALFVLHNAEDQLKERYLADADRIAYKALLLTAEGNSENVMMHLNPSIKEAGFVGAEIICCSTNALWGNRTGEAIERTLPQASTRETRPIHLMLYHPPVQETVTGLRNRFFLMTAIATLVFGFFLTWVILRFISRPVQELVSATRQAATGDFSVRLNSTREDELGQLSRFFDRMIGEIQREFQERQQAEEALRHTHNFVRTTLDSMSDGISVIDAHNFKIIGVNAAFLEEYGISEAEALGKTCYEVTHHRPDQCQPPNDVCPVYLSLQSGEHASTEHLHSNNDGSITVAEISVSPIKNEDGIVVQLVHISRDITKRKADEEKMRIYADELHEANEEMKNFTSIVSHDLKAPLVSINGFSHELADTLQDLRELLGQLTISDEQKKRLDECNRDLHESVNFIAASVTRMDGLINSVLALSRAGRRELSPELIDMETMVQTILKSLGHQIESNKVCITVSELPPVTADRISIEQIIGNLVDNAIKFLDSSRPGHIEISSESSLFDNVYHVKDNGRGISEADCGKIFDLFQRAGIQDVAGEGMGLAYVKALVRRHGGRIWCKSIKGEGSTFSFSIPKEQKIEGMRKVTL
jgi:PAS domain S-box-containing protein